jgi:hypothetical protein
MATVTELLHFDEPIFSERYNRLPFKFRHELSAHPLLQLSRLRALAHALPPSQVLHHAGDLEVGADFDSASRKHKTGLSLDESFERIAEKSSFVMLKNVESDPAYRDLLESLLREVAARSEPRDPGMHDRMGYIFVASPGAVTPYHMDREINFLTQIRGRKVMRLWDPSDPEVLDELACEVLFARPDLPKPSYRDELAAKAFPFEIGPGDGVHHPFLAPHWAQNGDEVSIAFAITFRTHETHRRASVLRANHALRKLGWDPCSSLDTGLRNRVKTSVYGAYGVLKGLLRPR